MQLLFKIPPGRNSLWGIFSISHQCLLESGKEFHQDFFWLLLNFIVVSILILTGTKINFKLINIWRGQSSESFTAFDPK